MKKYILIFLTIIFISCDKNAEPIHLELTMSQKISQTSTAWIADTSPYPLMVEIISGGKNPLIFYVDFPSTDCWVRADYLEQVNSAVVVEDTSDILRIKYDNGVVQKQYTIILNGVTNKMIFNVTGDSGNYTRMYSASTIDLITLKICQ